MDIVTLKPKKILVGGIGISVCTLGGAFDFARTVFGNEENHPCLIVTPNPEMVVGALRNPGFRKVLNESDLAIPDGTGLVVASRFYAEKIPVRIPGIDFIEYLLKNYSERPLKVFVLGGRKDTAKRAAQNMKKNFPVHEFIAASLSPIINKDGTYAKKEEENVLTLELNHHLPDLLLVGFGAPKQELWAAKNTKNFPAIKIVAGIGGALDVWSGNKKRAPRFLCCIGLEWLWRLAIEPGRILRIFRAVIIFPLIVIISGIKNHGHKSS